MWRVCQLSVLLPIGGLVTAGAATADHPYSAIGGRNVFGLKPPVVVTNAPVAPVTPAAGIDLQGITTILGRPQVFLRLKLPARPPKPPEDQSIVLEAGQREGDIEVISIDTAGGIVRIKNRGDESTLTMKDNAATPSNIAPAPNLAPANPPPGVPRPNLPGIPLPGAGANPTAPAATPTAFGSAAPTGNTPNPAVPNMPTRSLRSNQADARQLPLEAQMALIEVERERTRNAVEAGKMPPLPPINLPTTPGAE